MVFGSKNESVGGIMSWRSIYPQDFVNMTFKLGDEFDSKWGRIRFIRSTRKGFNFLIVERHKLLLFGRHLYDKNYSKKELPSRETIFTVKVPLWFVRVMGRKLDVK